MCLKGMNTHTSGGQGSLWGKENCTPTSTNTHTKKYIHEYIQNWIIKKRDEHKTLNRYKSTSFDEKIINTNHQRTKKERKMYKSG